MTVPTSQKLEKTFIDLFAGAGGLSEGFIQAGFTPVAHVEMNASAAQTLETRAAYYYLLKNDKLDIYNDYLTRKISREEFLQHIPISILKTIICRTMSNETLPDIFKTIDGIIKIKGIKEIDVIVGGPPCQAYSLVGRAQSSHMKVPMSEDPRNDLYKLYAKCLSHYQPKMFVFENVAGITSANGGITWKKLQTALRRVGYKIECRKQLASNFSVLQGRKRMIIVGWLKNSKMHYPVLQEQISSALVNDLLQDLPKLKPGQKATSYSTNEMSEYLSSAMLRTKDDVLTLHESRPHNERDQEIYKKAIRLWNNGHKRLKYDDLPEELKTHKNRTSFIDRFKVVEGDTCNCHTILAHLAKDGHYFIHPDIRQHRSITVREAARIQSFPDNYFFEGPKAVQFMQVGNAVPPLMAKAIAIGIAEQLAVEEQ